MIHKHQHYDLLGKVVLERVVFTPPLRLKERLESEACLVYSIKGNSTLHASGENHNLSQGSGVLMKCGNYFNHWHVNKDDSKNDAVAIHFYPDLIQYIYKDKVPEFLISAKDQKSTGSPVINGNQILASYIESLLPYFNHPEIVDEDVIILKVKELLSLLYKMNRNNIRTLLNDLFNPENLDIKHIVTKNLFEDISLEELAHLCNLSLSSFKRKFKVIFNDSPASYIKNKRLEKAAELFAISRDRVIDICFNCGFSNVDSFSKAFKTKYGYTPSEYRKKMLT